MTEYEAVTRSIAEGRIRVDTENGAVYRTFYRKQTRAGSITNLGYRAVDLIVDGKRTRTYEHRIVWISLNGEIPDGMFVDHVNSDKQDNRASNLQLLTHYENSHKAMLDGRYKTAIEKDRAGDVLAEARSGASINGLRRKYGCSWTAVLTAIRYAARAEGTT